MYLTIQHIQSQPDILAQCGGKAKNLYLLRLRGFSVPDFIVLPVTTIHQILGDKAGVIKQLINETDLTSQEAIVSVADKIALLLTDLRLTEAQIKEVTTAVSMHLAGSNCFSVRSSALFEDDKNASFAGLFTTHLDVTIADLETAIVACIRAAFKAQVLRYSAIKHLNPADNELTLIIQKMITATVSGIVFTMNSLGNFNDTHISAGFGSGEGVVSNKTDTTSYFVNRQNTDIHIGEGDPNVLSTTQVSTLFEQCMAIERAFGFPQDIEFSFDESGKLWLLQTRPITNIDITNLKILDNSNIVESYPGLTLPLSFTFARNGYQQVFTSAARLFGVSEADIARITPELSAMITHVHGRVYYNLHHWYKLMQMVVADENSMQAWETLIGIKSAPKKGFHFSVFKQLKTGFRSLSLLFRYSNLVATFFAAFDRDFTPLRNFADQLYTEKPTPKSAIEYYNQVSKGIFVHWATTLLNDFFTFKFYDYLRQMVVNYGFAESDNIANDLLCGITDMDSEKPIIALLTMKEIILNDAELSSWFHTLSASEIRQKIQQKKGTLTESIADYIAKYGDRTLEELKLESPNFRQNPDGFYELLQTQLANKNTPESFRAAQIHIRSNAEKKITEKQKQNSFIKNTAFNYVLKKTKETVKNRENMRIRRAMAYGAAKEIFYYIGTCFVAEKIIDAPKDIFYLTMQEMEAICCQKTTINPKEIIENRKNDYQIYATQTLPDRIVFNDRIPELNNSSQVIAHDTTTLMGTGISKGSVTAEVLVLDKPAFAADVDNKILVTRMTDPAWVFLMSRAAGIITEKGSPLSHTAIVGRELGIPVIIGLKNATLLLQTGQTVAMNGDTGEVNILSKP